MQMHVFFKVKLTTAIPI